jgi:hypothetical protein
MTTFNPMIGERIRPAWIAALDLLADGDWHSRRECVDVMLAGSDLAVATCSNVLRNAARDGLLEQRGTWLGRGNDHRHLRLPATQEDA